MGRTQKKQIVIRLTDRDFIKVKNKVSQSGLSQAEFLRRAILNKPIHSINEINQIVVELKRIGNNLNQISRNCNMGQPIVFNEIKNIGEEFRTIWQLLRRYLQEQA